MPEPLRRKRANTPDEGKKAQLMHALLQAVALLLAIIACVAKACNTIDITPFLIYKKIKHS
jgi:hypothetical protein